MSKHKGILVTGSSGFFGNHLVSFLKSLNYKVYTLSSSDKNSDFLINLSDKNLDFKSLNFNEISCIVHCAFQIPQSKEYDNETLLNTNNKITENIIKLSSYCGNLNNFINLSSIAVYPIKTGVCSEESETNPALNWNTNYGFSKLYAEEKLSKEIELPVAHLRISQLLDDENYDDSLTSNFKEELQNNNSITVFGSMQRALNFISINYLCHVIEKIIQNPIKGIFNTGEKQISYYNLAIQVAKDLNYTDAEIIIKRPEMDVNFDIDTKKLEKAISLS